MSIHALPASLQEELSALAETGAYATESAILADAWRTLLSVRPDLRITIACRLYEKGRFSLGKAAEWSGLTLEQLKEELHRQGISRQKADDPEAIDVMARAAAKHAGRREPE